MDLKLAKKRNLNKSYGQHFIEDTALIDDLIFLSNISKKDNILEIGPGAGALTSKLAIKAKKVLAIEIDKKLIPRLKDIQQKHPNLTVINDDILAVDMENIIGLFSENGIKVVSNIPYYLTQDIIYLLIKNRLYLGEAYLMIQKEVGDKIIASPKDKSYGPLSIFCQYYANINILKTVPAICFVPPPKVDSVFIKLGFKSVDEFDPLYLPHEATFIKTVNSLFKMRRKTAFNNLSSTFDLPREAIKNIIDKITTKPTIRGEELSIKQMLKLASLIDNA